MRITGITGQGWRDLAELLLAKGCAMKQTTVESLAWSDKGERTRRKLFLAEMNAAVP